MKGKSPVGKYPKTMFRWLVMISLMFTAILVHTMVRTQSTDTILNISKAQHRLERIQSYRKELELEVARLKANGRITALAKTRLGLKPSTMEQTIYLEKGSY